MALNNLKLLELSWLVGEEALTDGLVKQELLSQKVLAFIPQSRKMRFCFGP